MGNNGLGINSFSGPMGEKEPAYGQAERLKVLSKIGVQSPPSVNAARTSKRHAVSGRGGLAKPPSGGVAAPPPAPTEITGEQGPVVSYEQQLIQFWQQLAAEPGASPLVQKIAAQAVNGV